MAMNKVMSMLEKASYVDLKLLDEISETAARNNRIPKIIHFCFLNWKNIPDLFLNYLKSWINVLDGSYLFVNWTPQLTEPVCDWEKYMLENNKFAFYSDYVRVAKVYEYGGVYLDCDALVCKDLSLLLDLDYLFCADYSRVHIECAAFMAKRHNELLQLVKNEYESVPITVSMETPFIAPIFWEKALKKNNCKTFIIPKEHYQQYSKLVGNLNTQTFYILEGGTIISTCPERHGNHVSDIIGGDQYIVHGHEWSWSN